MLESPTAWELAQPTRLPRRPGPPLGREPGGKGERPFRRELFIPASCGPPDGPGAPERGAAAEGAMGRVATPAGASFSDLWIFRWVWVFTGDDGRWREDGGRNRREARVWHGLGGKGRGFGRLHGRHRAQLGHHRRGLCGGRGNRRGDRRGWHRRRGNGLLRRRRGRLGRRLRLFYGRPRNNLRLRNPLDLHLDGLSRRRGQVIGAIVSRQQYRDQHHVKEGRERKGQAVSPR